MEKQESKSRTLIVKRIIRASPERIYNAFLDPDAMAKWLPPSGFTGRIIKSDVKVGGGYTANFTNLTTGEKHTFGGTYIELIPFEKISYVDKFEFPKIPGEMNITIELRKTLAGTEVTITTKNIPDEIPMDRTALGWQDQLHLLELLVEVNIPSTPVSAYYQ